MSLLGPYLAGCILLVVAGVAKALRPGDTARALAAVRRRPLPLAPVTVAVRVGAACEAALGALAVAWPHPVAAGAVAGSYVAFAVFVAVARARGGVLATCGCFGAADTPPTVLHLLLDLLLGASAVAVAAGAPSGALPAVLAHQPLHGVPLLAGAALGAYLVAAAMSALARLQGVRLLLSAESGEPGDARR